MSDLKDIKNQKKQLIEVMSEEEPGSEEYKKALETYKLLIETETTVRDSRSKRNSEGVGTMVKVGTLIVSGLAAIGVPIYLAERAYQHEEQNMDMKNGTIWNLIGKRFDK